MASRGDDEGKGPVVAGSAKAKAAKKALTKRHDPEHQGGIAYDYAKTLVLDKKASDYPERVKESERLQEEGSGYLLASCFRASKKKGGPADPKAPLTLGFIKDPAAKAKIPAKPAPSQKGGK